VWLPRNLPTEYGEFRLHAFENQIDKAKRTSPLCAAMSEDGRESSGALHSQCLTGDVLRSARCELRRAQLDKACVGSRLKVVECYFI